MIVHRQEPLATCQRTYNIHTWVSIEMKAVHLSNMAAALLGLTEYFMSTWLLGEIIQTDRIEAE